MTEQSNATPGYLARFLIIARALEGAALAMAPLMPHEYDLVLACLNAQTAPALDFDVPADLPNPHGNGPAKLEEDAPAPAPAPAAPAKGKREPKVVPRPEGKRAPRGEWKRLVTEEINNRGIGGEISTADLGRLIGSSPAVASQRASMLLKAGVLDRKGRGSFEIKLLAIPEAAAGEGEGEQE